MTIGELIGCVVVVVWLVGAGLLAHAIPKWLEENDITQMGMVMMPELISVVMAIVIASWPVSMPALIIMKKMKERQ